MINRYDAKYLFGMKKQYFKYGCKVSQRYRLSFLKKIFETDTTILFEVKNEFKNIFNNDKNHNLRIVKKTVDSFDYFSNYKNSKNIGHDKLEYGRLISDATKASYEQDWVTSADAWAMIERYFPGKCQLAPVKCARALRNLQQLDDAEHIINNELIKGNVLVYAMAEYAEIAMARGEWRLALQRWDELENDFPSLWIDYPKRRKICLYNLFLGDDSLEANGHYSFSKTKT
jgi:hypothetical protein